MTGTCAYCGRAFDPASYGTMKTRDHIVPKSMAIGMVAAAGRHNIVDVCGMCNGLKGQMMPSAIRAHAEEYRKRAMHLELVANQVDRLIIERGLLP